MYLLPGVQIPTFADCRVKGTLPGTSKTKKRGVSMRGRRVTRTIKVTNVNAFIVEGDVVVERPFVLSGNFKTDEEVLKKLKKSYPETIFVRVKDFSADENIYAMSEADFIAYADVIEKR